MDEGDVDELLPHSDEDWMTENEEPCLPSSTTNEKECFIPSNSSAETLKSKLYFIGLGCVLIFASTFLLIILPLYSNAVNIKGDSYTLLLFTSTITVLILFVCKMLMQHYFNKNVTSSTTEISHYTNPNNNMDYICKLSVSLGFAAILIIYSIDQKRVMCHLQDPIKGIILVFALVFYFFFCRKLMELQRIFSCTTIIVGLFISVDYGLCDEFRCRGYERETRADDAGNWANETHALWSGIYILGLAFYTAHFTLLERCIVPVYSQPVGFLNTTSSLLSTVSRLVSSTDAVSTTETSSHFHTDLERKKTKSTLSLTFWIHFSTWLIILIFFWIDFIPDVGKAHGIGEFWNNQINGLSCHFLLPNFNQMPQECANVSLYAWPFALIYVIFCVTSIKFLSISQSAVFTVAMVTVSLPITGIWWSLFQINDIHGIILWSPSLSGELICSLLGLPIVLLGVGLLYKSHFKEIHINQCELNRTEHEYSSESTGLA